MVRPRLRALAVVLASAPPPRPLALWAGLFLLTGSFAAFGGPRFMPDSATYEFWADRLIAERFDLSLLVPEHGSPLGLTYVLFVALVALLKLAFGPAWAWALIMLAAASVAAVGALLARLAHRITGSGLAAWSAAGMFAASFDVLQWVPRVGSDSIFLLFAYLVFLMEAHRILDGRGLWSPVFAASAAASLFRPTGIVLFPISLWSFTLSRTRAQPKARARLLLLLLLLAFAAAAALALFWQDAARWPFGFAAGEVEAIARGYGEGQVVWDRRETYHAPPAALADYWRISLDRFLHFFAPGAAAYSPAHWAAQALFFAPVYLLGGWFTVQLARGKAGLGHRESDACFAAIGAILAYAVFHGVVQIDYDWRYRIPVMPHFILLAACGVSLLAKPWRSPA